KNEETLRDHFVANLRTHFDNATGETFNNKGKTDIFIRLAGHTVLVGECKNWSGPKRFLEALDQLLGYLTWRDTDAALIVFARKTDASSVVKTIDERISKHECFAKALGKQQQGWFNFTFRLSSGSDVAVRLAVMIFHFPDAE